MPNYVSFTHRHEHDYVIGGMVCDCGNNIADTLLMDELGVVVVQIPGLEAWTITRRGNATTAMFADFNAATGQARKLAREMNEVM